MPVVEDERQIEPRTSREVAQRCIAVVLCAVKGETQGEDQEFIEQLVQDYDAEACFSPAEACFIRSATPEHQELIDYCWRYECVHVFLWALGQFDNLQPPNTICNVADEVDLIRGAVPRGFIEDAKLRPQSEILDVADLYYRLHWAAIHLRLHGQQSDAIDEGIIRERHRALNWLIRYMNQEWDDVTTDT